MSVISCVKYWDQKQQIKGQTWINEGRHLILSIADHTEHKGSVNGLIRITLWTSQSQDVNPAEQLRCLELSQYTDKC